MCTYDGAGSLICDMDQGGTNPTDATLVENYNGTGGSQVYSAWGTTSDGNHCCCVAIDDPALDDIYIVQFEGTASGVQDNVGFHYANDNVTHAVSFATGYSGDDVLHASDEYYQYLLAGPGGRNYANHLTGNGGSDTFYGGESLDYFSGGDQGDTMYGYQDIDRLEGDGGPDYLDGGSEADELFGGDHDDDPLGGSGDDYLDGGDGDDDMSGDGEADVLIGGTGADEMCSGAGTGDTLNGGGISGDP